jgi:glycosyltransferase involved in cell wall biosynthesis
MIIGRDISHPLFESIIQTKSNNVVVTRNFQEKVFRKGPLFLRRRAIKKLLLREEIDLICTILRSYLHAFNRIDIPYFVYLTGDVWTEKKTERPKLAKKYLPLATNALEHSAGIFTNSYWLKNIIESHVENVPVYVLYNGTDLERFHPSNDKEIFRNEWGIKDDEIVLLSVMNMNLSKKIEGLIWYFEALKKIEHPVVIVICGDGKHREYVENAAKSVTNHKIIFTGRIKVLEYAYAGCDIFVHPSFYDSLARVLNEAAAMGLPMIIFDVGGCAERFTHNENALIVSRNNMDSLLNSIRQLILNEELRSELGNNARNLAEKAFHWQGSQCWQIFRAYKENKNFVH